MIGYSRATAYPTPKTVQCADWSKSIVNSGNCKSRVLCNMAAPIDGGAAVETPNNMYLKKVVGAAPPLSLRIIAECPVTKARACDLILPHSTVLTPVFMPVGTQGTMKGITVDQLEGLGCQICLGNTYHLGMRPVCIQMTLSAGRV